MDAPGALPFVSIDVPAYLWSLAPVLAVAIAGWLVSVVRRDVSIVDVLWGPMWAIVAGSYALRVPATGPRAIPVLALTTLWAVRLAAYLAWRNAGQGEDRRYRALRARHQPHFAWKSLGLVFGLQAVLAWGLVLPLAAAITAPTPIGPLDVAGIGIWIGGLLLETVADTQLARFKADPACAGQVMDRGVWAWSRHPNYFGECVAWWGAFLVAAAGGAFWTIVAPLLLTWLLLRVSGVALLERNIHERRPAYREYARRTPAFVPRLRGWRAPTALIILLLATDASATSTGTWRFQVFLDGREIGWHEFRLENAGDLRRLTSRAEFDVRFLRIPLYTYRHTANETWRGACLDRLESNTDDNGARSRVRGARSAAAFTVAGDPPVDLPACVQPAVHYQLHAEGGVIDLWYSPEREWLGLASGPDGKRRLEYRLQ